MLDWPGVPRIILTPNLMEFQRLCEVMVGRFFRRRLNISLTVGFQKIDPKSDPATLCPRLARSLQNLTIIQKGSTDIISNGMPIPAELLAEGHGRDQPETLLGEVEGGLKRVGGQGDILSGSTGVLMAWGTEWVRGSFA